MQWDWAVEMKISRRKYFYVTRQVLLKLNTTVICSQHRKYHT